MRKTQSVIGQRFEKLIVIDEFIEGKYARCRCKCDCGNETTVYKHSLISGRTKSCGCYLKECAQIKATQLNTASAIEKRRNSRVKNLVNQQFGKLTVIRRSVGEWPTDNRYVTWACECECGHMVYATTSNLKRGNTTSCGCSRCKDLAGMRFGKLVAIERVASETWKCQCDCGAISKVPTGSLTSGHTQSCGCMKSRGEYEVGQMLLALGVTYESQYTFKDLLSSHGFPLLFDFAIFDGDKLKGIIEYQGEQHLLTCNKEYGRLQREETDDAKYNYCLSNGVPIYYIWFYDNVRERLHQILTELQLINMPILCQAQSSDCEGATTIS